EQAPQEHGEEAGRESEDEDADDGALQALQTLLESRLNKAVARAHTALAPLEAADIRMDAIVQAIPSDDIATTLNGCGVEASAKLSVSPSSLSLSGSVTSARFIVSGGKAPYSGTVLGVQLKGLSVENPLAGDRGFRLIRTSETPAGSAILLISDAAG